MDTKLRKFMEARCSTYFKRLQIVTYVYLGLLNRRWRQNFFIVLIYDNTILLLKISSLL
jgi:hypothetical protein